MSTTLTTTFRNKAISVTVPALAKSVVDAAIDALDISDAARAKAARDLNAQAEYAAGRIRRDRAKRQPIASNPAMDLWRKFLAESPNAERIIRRESGERYAYPVEIVDGHGAPHLVGGGYSFRWRGKWKSAPGSYQPSTHRIQVGLDWLRDNYARVAATTEIRVVSLEKVIAARRAKAKAEARAKAIAKHPECREMPDAILADHIQERGNERDATTLRS